MTTKTKVYIVFAILAALFIILAVIASCQPRPEEPAVLATPAAELRPVGIPGNWNMVLQTEFDSPGMPADYYPCPIWYNCTTGGRTDQGVGAKAWFVSSALSVPGDGYLHITATKRATPATYGGQSFPYNSGYIITGRNSTGAQGQWFQYGAFEARMKCPAFPGAWCAFWTWGDRAGQSGFTYPNTSNEIDITENLSRHPLVQNMNLHGAATFSKTAQLSSPNSDWHIYAVDWEPGYIRWYVDGRLVTAYSGTSFNSAWMYVIISLQLGSDSTGWAGPVDESGMVNGVLGEMLVDYVRVWKTASGPTVTPGPATATFTASTVPSVTLTRTPLPPTATRTATTPPTVTPVISLTPTWQPSVTPYPTLGAGCYSLPGGGYICVP